MMLSVIASLSILASGPAFGSSLTNGRMAIDSIGCSRMKKARDPAAISNNVASVSRAPRLCRLISLTIYSALEVTRTAIGSDDEAPDATAIAFDLLAESTLVE